MFFCGQKIFVVGSENFTMQKGEVVDIADDFISVVSDDGVLEKVPYKFVTGITIIQKEDNDEEG